MRFVKEYVVLGLIVIFILGIDGVTASVTNHAIEEIDKEIDAVIQVAYYQDNVNKEEILEKIESLENKWNQVEAKLSYYSEHEELEKVTTDIIGMKANANMEAEEDAYEKIQKVKYEIEHIKNKQKLKWNNIF